jgi:two-component system NtrC family sensor kinase
MSESREVPGAGVDPGVAIERQLLDLQRRLDGSKRTAALSALVARLAHELGTPLHSISGHLDLMLADEALGAGLRQRTEIISGEVQRLSVMIRRYLTRLRPPPPDPRPTDIPDLVRAVLLVLEPVLDARGVTLELDLGPADGAPLSCDRDQVEQVLLNLVQNALDAMPRGGRLVIRASATDDGHAISVCDSGTGIPADLHAHVFEPFFSTKARGRGSGLGLSVCREIARAHGGDILLDSQPGVGTIVTLTLASLETAEPTS